MTKVLGISFSERDIHNVLGFTDQKPIQIKLVAPSKQIKLDNKEETRIAKFLAKYWRPGIRNRLELYFLGWTMKKGITYESDRSAACNDFYPQPYKEKKEKKPKVKVVEQPFGLPDPVTGTPFYEQAIVDGELCFIVVDSALDTVACQGSRKNLRK